MDLQEFLDVNSGPSVIWYLKRLSANDTQANGSHQAGHYIPKDLLFELFPSFRNRVDGNQDAEFDLIIESHECSSMARAIWYNNKFRGGTRNEARLTRLGGNSSPLQDPESTGSLVLFAFQTSNRKENVSCRVWSCSSIVEEDVLQGFVGPVEPAEWKMLFPYAQSNLIRASYQSTKQSCWLTRAEMDDEWFKNFPPGQTFIDLAVERIGQGAFLPDKRLLKRRACEYESFRSVEEAVEIDSIVKGFRDIDGFLKKAQSILQRRKSRSGRSLELHIKKIFEEEGLVSEESFSWQPITEMKRKPDFIFPSIEKYNDDTFPANRLRMLAVKTTCKDRWRQVINEAERVPRIHLLTLQEGVSLNQYAEMKDEGIVLVVPENIRDKYHADIRDELLNFESFIAEAKQVYSST